MNAYLPKTVIVDGVTYQVHLQGGLKHVRVYRAAPNGIRKVTDLETIHHVVNALQVANRRASEDRQRAVQREAEAAVAAELGVAGAKPIHT